MSKKASKEKIREAFRKTISRWQKIVKDPDYFKGTYCYLCILENDEDNDRQKCNDSCPIKNYKGEDHWACCDTPYNTFFDHQTKENARVELTFLCEVFIDFLEDEIQDEAQDQTITLKGFWEELEEEEAAEKKEEWVDVTERFEFRSYQAGMYYWIGIYEKYKSLQIGWLDSAGVNICTHAKKEYKIERQTSRGTCSWDNYFRIMRKE